MGTRKETFSAGEFTITDNSELFRNASFAAKIAALEAVGNQVVSDAKDNLEDDPRRVDTGRLKNSITHAVVDDTAVIIGTNVEYAIYVHEGTRKMEANRFLKRAIDEHRDELKDIVREQFENAQGG